ncbi:MAG: cytidylate kinase-like family protein [Lachnospiraceae bacterium]|nr:cytidylate kinase-like family protein [Lachnospiraceae bacterium]
MKKHFVITIARGYGSGGRTIGRMLAEKLGISYYDREIVRKASEDSGINEALFNQADEKLKKNLLGKLRRKKYDGSVLPPESSAFVSDDNLFNLQAKMIKEVAEKESCVIVGRCADYILKDRDDVISLYVHAPMEHCLDTLESMFSESRKDLRKKVEDIDKHRAAYYKYYTGRDWNDAHNYNLCIDTSKLTFEQGVEMVEAYLKILDEQ